MTLLASAAAFDVQWDTVLWLGEIAIAGVCAFVVLAFSYGFVDGLIRSGMLQRFWRRYWGPALRTIAVEAWRARAMSEVEAREFAAFIRLAGVMVMLLAALVAAAVAVVWFVCGWQRELPAMIRFAAMGIGALLVLVHMLGRFRLWRSRLRGGANGS